MPSSSVRIFADPDEYTAAIRVTTAKMSVVESGNFTAKLIRIDLHRLWMQRFFTGLPFISYVIPVARRAIITFYTDPGPSVFKNGLEIPPTDIVRFPVADEYYYRTPGPSSNAAMSLPVEDLAAASVMAGLDLKMPLDMMLTAPPAAAVARIRRLNAATGHLAEEAPEIIANPDAARGLEQALIEAMVGCLSHGQQCESTLARSQHAIVMRRFHRVVEENPEEPLYIPEICKVIRVSERTLRACCQEHLGMSPKQYLMLRRMRLVHRALRAAAPGAATVTDLATRYGFWDLGRFAGEYRALFGETPSVTLGQSR